MKKLLTVSKTALSNLKSIITENNSKYILVQVKGGGCNGLQYNIEPSNIKSSSDEIINFDDINVQVCGKSILYLVGSHIDWKKDHMGEGFTFTNPNFNWKLWMWFYIFCRLIFYKFNQTTFRTYKFSIFMKSSFTFYIFSS